MPFFPARLDLKPMLEGLPCPQQVLQVAYPCCGIKGSLAFESDWGLKTEACHVYDLEDRYAPLMEQLFGKGNYHLGPDDGDLTKIPLAQLTVPNFLMSGPPCPPWAGNGHKQNIGDIRSTAFGKALQD